MTAKKIPKKTGDHTLIIYARPYDGFFNYTVLEAAISALGKAGRPCDVVNLYAGSFDPHMPVEELALFTEGGTPNPLVGHHQKPIERTSRIIVVCPTQWSEAPSIIKGFVGKIMKRNWACHPTASGMKGHLTHVQQVLVLTTSIAPTRSLRRLCGSYTGPMFLEAILEQLDMGGWSWVNFNKVSKTDRCQHKKHLKRIARLVTK